MLSTVNHINCFPTTFSRRQQTDFGTRAQKYKCWSENGPTFIRALIICIVRIKRERQMIICPKALSLITPKESREATVGMENIHKLLLGLQLQLILRTSNNHVINLDGVFIVDIIVIVFHTNFRLHFGCVLNLNRIV